MNITSIVKKNVKAEELYKSNRVFTEKGKIYSFINPYGYHLMRKNIILYQQLDGLYIDGIFMCILSRLFYGIRIKRRSFDNTTVAKDLFEYLNKYNFNTIYFVGAKQEEIEQAIQQYKQKYPGINILGYRSGYFATSEERYEEVRRIATLAPDFVVVGMGAILQEDFLVSLKKQGFSGIGFTCGGFIRQSSSGMDYFPQWSNRFHLRFLYRLYKEKGTWKRLYNVLFQFPILFFIDYLNKNEYIIMNFYSL